MDYYPEQTEEYTNQALRWSDLGIAVMKREPVETQGTAADVNDLQAIAQAARAFIEQTQPARASMPATRSTELWMYAEGQWLAQLFSRFFGCDRVGIAVFTPKSGVLKPIAATGLAHEEHLSWWSAVQQVPIGMPLEKRDIARLRSDEIVVRAPEQIQRQIGSAPSTILIAPIRIAQHLFGIIGVEFAGAHLALAPTTVLMRALAKLASQALQGETLRQTMPKLEHKIQSYADETNQVGAFLSQTCHELRTPLTTIKASVQLAERQIQRISLTPPGSEALASALENVRHLLQLTNRHITLEDNLINDLLEMARIQTGKFEMHPVQYNLAAIVREAVEGQQLIWQGRDIRLDLPQGDVPVQTDPNRVMQVICNFLSNAHKYSPEDKPIEVKLLIENQRARVAVKDFGVGLPKHELKRIWERFYRARGIKVQSGATGSLGLGLYICRAIIQRQQGKVGVESAPGQGSTFWFTLPLTTPPEPMQI